MSSIKSVAYIELPGEPEPIHSPFYIYRSPIEELIFQEITKPGCAIRILAPHKMGKTSVTLRLINYAQNLGYRTIYIDFLQAEDSVFLSFNKFLRWLCANSSLQLQLSPIFKEYWQEVTHCQVNSSLYWQNYLLSNRDSPLVLVLNQTHQIFEYPQIALEFFSLLNLWHEQSQQDNSWQKFRLVIVQSTEISHNLDINRYPFNIGLAIHLSEFNLEQIQDLTRRYELNWTDEVRKQNAQLLKKMLGGHPYLLRLALYHLVKFPQKNLEELLQEASTATGIYKDFLLQKFKLLQQNSESVIAIKQLVANDEVELQPIIADKLESMGLIKRSGNRCTILCDCYRQYFTHQNLQEPNWQVQVKNLQRQIQELQRLPNKEQAINLADRQTFQIFLEEQWQRLANERRPISLILLEIEYFKTYCITQKKVAGEYLQ
ncbi:MAG: AAA-like domain-containing protein, partial [Scytonema sp. PMC 1069.18]|nr:AAA-like domain-containing protein [Scytonema sp. PMC 1069.18]